MTVPFKRESHRKEKVEGLIKQEVSKIITQELKDPRVAFCTVISAHLSADLKTANVSVSVMGDEASQRNTLRGLEHARSFIQRRLFQELELKYVPSVVFHLDHSIERSIRISKILREEGVPETDGFGEAGLPETNPDTSGFPEEGQEGGAG